MGRESEFDREAARQFVCEQTALRPLPSVPEVVLWLAHEPVALWSATEEWLTQRGLAPPFWAFGWAGGQAVARALLDRKIDVKGARVLDVASGSGLVAIAAALAGARSVTAVDLDPFAEVAGNENARANGVTIEARTGDGLAESGDGYDVVTAGDVFYEAEMAARFSERLQFWADRGIRVYAGDPGRTYVPAGQIVVAETTIATPVELEGRVAIASRVYAFRRSGDADKTA